jgi:hypothetical protein
MNLKFKISETTEIDSKTLIDRVLLILEQKKYRVIDFTKSTVSFDSRYGGVIWKSEYKSRLDRGNFEILNQGQSNVLIFEYYPIPKSEYLFVFFIIGLCIFLSVIIQSYYPCLISAGFLGMLVYKYFNLKRIADEMVVEVLNL